MAVISGIVGGVASAASGVAGAIKKKKAKKKRAAAAQQQQAEALIGPLDVPDDVRIESLGPAPGEVGVAASPEVEEEEDAPGLLASMLMNQAETKFNFKT